MGDLNYRYYLKRHNGAVETPLATLFSFLAVYFQRTGRRGVLLPLALLFLAPFHADAATAKDAKAGQKAAPETHGYFQP